MELSNSSADEQASIARARVLPGETTRWHCLHGVVERYVILAGEGQVETGSGPTEEVLPGDVVIIPAGQPQRIHNSGQKDLVFLAICTPRFSSEAYQDLEDIIRQPGQS